MKNFFADPDLGLIGLLFFFTFFVCATIWTFRPGGKEKYAKHGDIPFKENEE